MVESIDYKDMPCRILFLRPTKDIKFLYFTD